MEFNKTQHRVVVLEAGGFNFEEQSQTLYDLLNVGEPIRETPTRIRAFAGTLNLWGGAWKVLDEIDFEKRDWLPYSGWPISYQEVAKYWDIAANRYSLPPVISHRSEYWMSNLEATGEGKLINNDIRPSIIHQSRTPLDFRDHYYPDFNLSPNIDIYLHANVTHLQLNDSLTRIQAVHARSIQGKSVSCAAKFFVLACGGIENASLLLNSRDKMNGVGNQNNLVGRFYMDHPKGDFGILLPFDKTTRLPLFWGSDTPYGKITVGLSPTPNIMEKERLLNHWIQLSPVYGYQHLPGYEWLKHVRNKYPGGEMAKRILSRVKKIFSHSLGLGDLKYIIVHNRLEQAPNPDSRVYLSDERNVLGNQKVILDWKIGSLEKATIRRFHGMLRRCFKNFGLFVSNFDETERWPISADASHHLGTMRMGQNDKEGVVDKDCKVFGVENLFISGSSIFPTGGNANPTFTIVALSIRLADHLRRKLRG